MGACPKTQRQKYHWNKWVFKNKLNEHGEVNINKVRMVCKGYAQVEGIDFEVTFIVVARLGAIKMFPAVASHKSFKLYHMDVKTTFLNGNMEEEVYIEQCKGFDLSDNKDYVCKLKKSLYGLK